VKVIKNLPNAKFDELLKNIHKKSEPITPILSFFNKNKKKRSSTVNKSGPTRVFLHTNEEGRTQRWFEYRNKRLYLKLKKDSLTDPVNDGYDMSEAESIVSGKHRGRFSGSDSQDTDSALCFSVTFRNNGGTLDLEFNSISERDYWKTEFKRLMN